MNRLPETLPTRILGAVLLVGALDPARWPAYLGPQWFFGGAALVAGFWAAAPVVDRPEARSYRLRHQLDRYRNTLLAAAAALLAAFQSPPVWLMAVELALLLTYLILVDTGTAPGRPAAEQLSMPGTPTPGRPWYCWRRSRRSAAAAGAGSWPRSPRSARSACCSRRCGCALRRATPDPRRRQRPRVGTKVPSRSCAP